ncbi:MAG: hypothetical protein JXA10_01815 [Anaerolineae bacterium]|nr:hypothetical protein [Anaerolineae bacterium]
MQRFRVWWNSFKTVAILMSFIVNMVLLFVILILMMQIFQIKNGILEPLIDGLHSNFVGMDEAVIERTIAVEDEIPVVFDLPLNQSTSVVLTQDVPIAANATFTLPGGGGLINGRVDIVLPKDLVLPIQLSMTVPVDTTIPISLPVDVQIPLKETQLHTPFLNLRNLLEPYVRLIDNIPSDWSEVTDFTIDAIQGEGVNVLSPTEDSMNPWTDTFEPLPPGTWAAEQAAKAQDAASQDSDASQTDQTGTDDNGGSTDQTGAASEPTATPDTDMGIITPGS